jgi:hypothetical protein
MVGRKKRTGQRRVIFGVKLATWGTGFPLSFLFLSFFFTVYNKLF